MSLNALIRRLQYYNDLGPKDAQVILDLAGREIEFDAGADIIHAGQEMSAVLLMSSGWSVRYKILEDGRRQILNVLLPGDMFDLQVMVAAEADHSVLAITNTTVISIEPKLIEQILRSSGTLSFALWWTQVQEEAFLREQIIRNGRQTARERIGHFLLELHRRALMTDDAARDGFRMPLTQTHIADALGLTPIHTNRVLRQLQRDDLIQRDRSWIEFQDAERLAEICEFDSSYFHLDAGKRRLSLR